MKKKIADIDGIAEKLPKHKNYYTKNRDLYGRDFSAGMQKMDLMVRSTELDPNEICEVDIEKLKKEVIRFTQECWLTDVYTSEQAKKCFDRLTIAKSDCIKFKEKE